MKRRDTFGLALGTAFLGVGSAAPALAPKAFVPNLWQEAFIPRLQAFIPNLVFESVPTAEAAMHGFMAGSGVHDYALSIKKDGSAMDIAVKMVATDSDFVYFYVNFSGPTS